MTFANSVLDPGCIVAWLAVGLIVGRLAGKVMPIPGHGIFGDILLGLIGALVAGALPSLFVTGGAGFWVGVLTALIGACIFVGGARALVVHLTARRAAQQKERQG
jgi:uncharacterized membrane protein YeaQ/YmgE (transglycosylase-associated protein family)